MSIDALEQNYTKAQLLDFMYANPNVPATARLLRTILEDQSTYEQVREKLLKVPFNSIRHAFFTTVGTEQDEGSAFHVLDWYTKDSQMYNYQREEKLEAGQKYIVITNGFNNDFSVQRKAAGEFKMQQLNDLQLSDPNEVLIRVTSQYPNRNPRTIFTAALIPSSDLLEPHLYY